MTLLCSQVRKSIGSAEYGKYEIYNYANTSKQYNEAHKEFLYIAFTIPKQ